MPISSNLLNLILQEIEDMFQKKGQPYLAALYRAITVAGFYGLMRIAEMVGKHAVMTEDVKISTNLLKRKVKIILRTSKTHHAGNPPQIIDIVPDKEVLGTVNCPFNIMALFTQLRPHHTNKGSQFFIFSDGSRVTDCHFRAVLRRAIKNLGLSPSAFNTHSLRIGRASMLFKRNYSIDFIKKVGRWKNVSTAFKYFK